MTIANFKSWVIGFINRDSTIFTVSTIDHVLYAMNAARAAAQRDHTFELLRDDVFLTTSAAGALWTTGCKTTPGGATSVLMRRVDSVWGYTTAAIGATTYYPRTQRLNFLGVDSLRRELPAWTNVAQTSQSTTIRPMAYVSGAKLYTTTATTATTTMLLNGITWLDDLVGSESSDLFLTYFTDWLFWATLMQLNFFLKDQDKIPIDAAVVRAAWGSVLQLDGSVANMGDRADLD